jgi:nucleoside phosphorylase
LAPGWLLDESLTFPASDPFVTLADGIGKRLGLRVHSGTFGTSDSFIRREKPEGIKWIRENFRGVVCVEMEGAAIARVCARAQVPFFAVRVLSDVACREKGNEDYEKSVRPGSAVAADYIKQMLDAIAAAQ